MRGEAFASYSADKIVDEQNADNYPSEYLNTIDMSSLPPHLLKLKVGAPVILLRNLSPSTGLCNGTRLRVVRISQRVVECEILAGKYAGNMIFIPRIPLESSPAADLPFNFKRTLVSVRYDHQQSTRSDPQTCWPLSYGAGVHPWTVIRRIISRHGW
jgi:hypothetical protein